MPLKSFKPTSPGKRHSELPDYSELTAKEPEKSLLKPLKRRAGRNNQGRVTIRGRGGGHKREYRVIDFARDKEGVPAEVESLEYDPNRSAWIALLKYLDGERKYIIAPRRLKVGAKVRAGEGSQIKPGNALPLKSVPVGTPVYNVEFTPGSEGKIARSAGTQAQVLGKDEQAGEVRLKLPSGEVRVFDQWCQATIGQVSNPDHQNVKSGKAGRKRHLGRRPKTRGVAMNAVDHPHGGGEGRGHVGRPPVSPKGLPAKGGKTRRKKDNKRILKGIGRRRGK